MLPVSRFSTSQPIPASCTRGERGTPSRGACAAANSSALGRYAAADNFDRVFAALNKQRPDGLYVLGRLDNAC